MPRQKRSRCSSVRAMVLTPDRASTQEGRLIDESQGITSADVQSSKKRKALADLPDTDRRINGPSCSPIRALSEPSLISDKAPQPEQIPSQASDKSENGQIRHSRPSGLEGKPTVSSWPKILEPDAFANASIREQRDALALYKQELIAYVDLIEAGAIPTRYVMRLLSRMDSHFAKLADAFGKVHGLLNEQSNRKMRVAEILHEDVADHQGIIKLVNHLRPVKATDVKD